MKEFVERQRGNGDFDPAADSALGESLSVHHAGRAGRNDAVERLVIDELLELELPVILVLDLVEEKDHGLAFGVGRFVVKPKDFWQRQELQDRVVEAQVDETLRISALGEKALDELKENGRLAHPPRPTQVDGSTKRPVGKQFLAAL